MIALRFRPVYERSSSSVRLAITIEHNEPAYVEERGGYALLSHLRGAPARIEHRREALQRAFDLFEAAERAGAPEPEIGGLGLLVLQRALLAAEDLGGLLHAFAGSDPWDRLRTAKIPDLDAAYQRAVEDFDGTVTAVFRLAAPELIDETGTAEERAVLHELRVRTMRRWSQMLARSARLWLEHRNVAKATMHGFPIIAGAHIEGPPPAGEIADGIRPPGQRYAVAVTSRVSGAEITTDRTIVGLGRGAVSGYHRDGRAAARLAGELCDIQATTIMSQHAATVPLRSASFLNSKSQAIAEALLADRGAEG